MILSFIHKILCLAFGFFSMCVCTKFTQIFIYLIFLPNKRFMSCVQCVSVGWRPPKCFFYFYFIFFFLGLLALLDLSLFNKFSFFFFNSIQTCTMMRFNLNVMMKRVVFVSFLIQLYFLLLFFNLWIESSGVTHARNLFNFICSPDFDTLYFMITYFFIYFNACFIQCVGNKFGTILLLTEIKFSNILNY